MRTAVTARACVLPGPPDRKSCGWGASRLLAALARVSPAPAAAGEEAFSLFGLRPPVIGPPRRGAWCERFALRWRHVHAASHSTRPATVTVRKARCPRTARDHAHIPSAPLLGARGEAPAPNRRPIPPLRAECACGEQAECVRTRPAPPCGRPNAAPGAPALFVSRGRNTPRVRSAPPLGAGSLGAVRPPGQRVCDGSTRCTVLALRALLAARACVSPAPPHSATV